MTQILKKERKYEYSLNLLGIVTWAYATYIKDSWGHSNCVDGIKREMKLVDGM